MFRSNIILSPLTVLLSVSTLLTAHASDPISEDWSVDLGSPILGSPLVRDLDGDGDYEILASSSANGEVYVLDHHGQPLDDGWPVRIVVDEPRDIDGDGVIYTTNPNLVVSPSLGDIDGDGQLDIVVADANSLSWQEPLGAVKTKAATYSYLHAWELDGTPKVFTGIGDNGDTRVWLDGSIKSVPRLIDVDGDGSDELLLHTGASKLYLLNGDGTVRTGWPVALEGETDNFGSWSIGSSPIALDLDFDGEIEIAVATTGGEVHVYDVDGNAVSGWPVSTDGVEQGDGFHLSSLAAVDLNGDYQLELVLGGADGKVYAWHADGTRVSGFPTVAVEASISASVAAANLRTDFAGPELVVVDTAYRVSCFSSSGGLLWSQADAGSASPIIVDSDNDGDFEVVVPYVNKVHVFEADGTKIDALSFEEANDWIDSSPVCADLDRDGDLELLYASIATSWESSPGGTLYCAQLSTSGSYASRSVANGWPSFLADRGDAYTPPVWELYDDFSGSALDEQKWEIFYLPGGQLPVVSDGQLRLENGGGSGRKDPAFLSALQSAGIDLTSAMDHSGVVFTDPSIIGIEAELLMPAGVAADSGVLIELFEQDGPQEIRSAGIELGYWGESQAELWFHKSAYSNGDQTSEVSNAEDVTLGEGHRVRMLRRHGSIDLYWDDLLLQTHAAEGELLALFIAAFNDEGQPMYATIDNVRVLRDTTSGPALTVVESYGEVYLLEGDSGYYADHADTPLLYNGMQISSSTYPGVVGVDIADGTYRVLRYDGSEYYAANFSLNGISSSTWTVVNDLFLDEENLQQDINDDGHVGTPPLSSVANLQFEFIVEDGTVSSKPAQFLFQADGLLEIGFSGSILEQTTYTYSGGVISLTDWGQELRLDVANDTSGTFEVIDTSNQDVISSGSFSVVTSTLTKKTDWQRRETFDATLSTEFWNNWSQNVDSVIYNDGQLNFLFDLPGNRENFNDPQIEIEYARTLPMDEDWQVVYHGIYASNLLDRFGVHLMLDLAEAGFVCDLQLDNTTSGRRVSVWIQQGDELDYESAYSSAYASVTAFRDERLLQDGIVNFRVRHNVLRRDMFFEYQPEGANEWTELARLNLNGGGFIGESSIIEGLEFNDEVLSTSQRMSLGMKARSNQATQVGDLEIDGIEIAEIKKSRLKVQVSLAKGISGDGEATVLIDDVSYPVYLVRGKGTVQVALPTGSTYAVSASMSELTGGDATSVTLTKSKTLKLVLDGDSDVDGLSDSKEARYKGDPKNDDTDEDGISDGDEVYKHGTRVNSADTDKDGLSDYEEIKTYSTNPLKADSDGDRMSDYAEIEAGTDPLDKSEYPANLKVQVSLAKGISGDGEAIVLIDDVEYPVSLVRGKGTVQVALPTGSTYTVSASMGELTGGEATSVTLTKSKTLKLVLDGDSDGDGLSDSKEARYKGDPNNADTDGDGISDGEEVKRKTKVNVADSDKDGFTDKQELDLGTNPLSSKDKPAAYIERSVRTDWELTYDAEDGYIKETWSGDEFALLLGSARGAETDSATLHLKYSLDGSNVRWIVRDGVQDLDVTTLMRRLKVSKPGKLDAAVMSPIDESSGAYYGAEMFTLSVNLGGGKSLSLVVSGESAFSPVGENESGLDFDLAESADYKVLGVLQNAKLSEGPILIKGTLTMGDEVANVLEQLIRLEN